MLSRFVCCPTFSLLPSLFLESYKLCAICRSYKFILFFIF